MFSLYKTALRASANLADARKEAAERAAALPPDRKAATHEQITKVAKAMHAYHTEMVKQDIADFCRICRTANPANIAMNEWLKIAQHAISLPRPLVAVGEEWRSDFMAMIRFCIAKLTGKVKKDHISLLDCLIALHVSHFLRPEGDADKEQAHCRLLMKPAGPYPHPYVYQYKGKSKRAEWEYGGNRCSGKFWVYNGLVLDCLWESGPSLRDGQWVFA